MDEIQKDCGELTTVVKFSPFSSRQFLVNSGLRPLPLCHGKLSIARHMTTKTSKPTWIASAVGLKSFFPGANHLASTARETPSICRRRDVVPPWGRNGHDPVGQDEDVGFAAVAKATDFARYGEEEAEAEDVGDESSRAISFSLSRTSMPFAVVVVVVVVVFFSPVDFGSSRSSTVFAPFLCFLDFV